MQGARHKNALIHYEHSICQNTKQLKSSKNSFSHRQTKRTYLVAVEMSKVKVESNQRIGETYSHISVQIIATTVENGVPLFKIKQREIKQDK